MNQFNKFREFVHGNLQRNENNRQILSSVVLKEEKHVENIKSILSTAEKKLSNSLFNPKSASSLLADGGHGLQSSDNKKTKKFPSASLHKFFNEASDTLNSSKNDSVLSKTLLTCSQLQNDFTSILVEHESEIERHCLNEIQRYLTEDLPSIHKTKKQLTKANEELKSARQKYESLSKQTSNQNDLQNKRDELRKEMEYAGQKVEQSRDAYEIEIFDFLGKELTISEIFFRYIKLLEVYHERMLQQIHHYIPALEGVLQNTSQKPVFGVPLEEHLRSYGKKISIVIEKCVEYLCPFAKEEGLFRIPGSVSKVKRMRNAFNAGRLEALYELKNDAPAVVSTLKSYLRELPEPLLTSRLCQSWVEASKMSDPNDRLKAMLQVCNKLPEANRNNLCYLLKFLNELTKLSERNKMSSQNLAIALGPSLLWSRDSLELSMSNHVPTIVEALITHCDYFFPEESYSDLFTSPSFNYNNSDNYYFNNYNSDQELSSPTNRNSQQSLANSLTSSNNKKKAPAPKPPSSTSPTVPTSQSPIPDNNISPNISKTSSKLRSKLSFKIKSNSDQKSNVDPIVSFQQHGESPSHPVVLSNLSVAPDDSQGQIYLRKSPVPVDGPTFSTFNAGTKIRPRSVSERPMVPPPMVPPRPSLAPKPEMFQTFQQHQPTTQNSQPLIMDKYPELNHIDSESEENSLKDSPLNSMKPIEEINQQQKSKLDETKMANITHLTPRSLETKINDELMERLRRSESPPDTPPMKPPRANSTNSNNSSYSGGSISSSNQSLNNDHHQQTTINSHQKHHQRSESLTFGMEVNDNNNGNGGPEDQQNSLEKTKSKLDQSPIGEDSSVAKAASIVNQTHL